MSKPIIHALSSARKFWWKAEDYIEIHNLMDLSKWAIADNRHRVLTHNSWFLSNILERIFWLTITNSDWKHISVRDIWEQHVLEDFKWFIPTAQDYIEWMEFADRMNNWHGKPPSLRKNLSFKNID